MPMDDRERQLFFGGIPASCFLVHRWFADTIRLGEIPGNVTAEISRGKYCEPVAVELNSLLPEGGFDVIFSVGQVVPHEVVGMANYSKNLFVGLGGREMINKSHMLSAICGIESALGDPCCVYTDCNYPGCRTGGTAGGLLRREPQTF